MEYARLQPLAERFGAYHDLERDLAAAREMLRDSGPGMRSLGCGGGRPRRGAPSSAEEAELRKLLIPKDPRDDKNIFLEVRAGTGGDEAAIFAGDLFRMYCALRGSPRADASKSSARTAASTAAIERSSAASPGEARSRG